jgi:alanyl-tRNA synthetase
LTGENVIRHYEEEERELTEATQLLKTTPGGLLDKIRALQAELKEAHSEIESLKSEAAKNALGDVMGNVQEINGVKFLASKVEGVDAGSLRELGDSLKEKLGEGVVLLASVEEGKVQLMATATDGVIKKGAHAGNLIRGIAKMVGGGGGGRPNMAMAGGKNPLGIDDALAEAVKVLKGQIQ